MAPLCSSNEGSTHRKCPGVDTRSVRRASGLLETGFSVTCQQSIRMAGSPISPLWRNASPLPVQPRGSPALSA